MLTAALGLLVWTACGPTAPDCATPDATFAEAGDRRLTCAEAAPIREAAELLKGHRLSDKDRAVLLPQIASEFRSDPEGLATRLRAASDLVAELRAARDAAAAELRATRAWEVHAGQHALVRNDEPLRTALASAMSVWTKDDREKLVLTESDIEGWVRYASLCAEASQRSPLKISVADRVGIYSDEKDKFLAADRPTKIAILTVGALWTTLHDAWPGVTYEQQQRWTAKAEFPPAMDATSLAYLDALLATDPASHASAITAAFGPLALGPPEAR